MPEMLNVVYSRENSKAEYTLINWVQSNISIFGSKFTHAYSDIICNIFWPLWI